MSKTPRPLRWLIGGLVGFSLLSACGAPEEQPGNKSELIAPEAAAGEVAANLSIGTTALSAKDDVQVTVTLTNVSSHAVRLLKWNTPVEGIEEPLFQVTRDGTGVAFIGPHYKRPAPQAGDYVLLAPAESLTRTVSLAGYYDLSKTGSYSIRYGEGSHSGVSQSTSNSVTVWVEGRANILPEAQGAGVVSAFGLSYSNCTATQQPGVQAGFDNAKIYATNALNYLSTTPPGPTSRYTTWFGAYNSSGWSTAKSHFTAIKSAFDTQPVVVDCKCKKNYYAYVYPTQPYTIYVCNAFWTAPTTGTDSKAGTLIHEMSHFNVVASTDDWVYGQAGCKNLAISNPTNALDNADCHEYFAENNPALP